MASKRTRANKPEMIHCPYCGEDYSSTYKLSLIHISEPTRH